jgi:hypothetical protein
LLQSHHFVERHSKHLSALDLHKHALPLGFTLILLAPGLLAFTFFVVLVAAVAVAISACGIRA